MTGEEMLKLGAWGICLNRFLENDLHSGIPTTWIQ